jgi:hypothetical protein
MALLSQIGFAHSSFPSSTSNTHLRNNPCSSMSSSWTPFDDTDGKKSKKVWIWTKNKQVMTAAVERGWNTFIFPSNLPQLANDWSCMYFYFLSLIFSLYFK